MVGDGIERAPRRQAYRGHGRTPMRYHARRAGARTARVEALEEVV